MGTGGGFASGFRRSASRRRRLNGPSDGPRPMRANGVFVRRAGRAHILSTVATCGAMAMAAVGSYAALALGADWALGATLASLGACVACLVLAGARTVRLTRSASVADRKA